MPRFFLHPLTLLVAAVLVAFHPAAAEDDWDKELAGRRRECDRLFARWQRTRDLQRRASLGEELLEAAIRAERPGVIEEIAAGGELARKEIKLPRRARSVPLRELRTFDGIETSLGQEDGYYAPEYADGKTTAKGWLVRRITPDAWEVWTPAHGWLLDAKGQVLNEARPQRGEGTGREWFGAFLPDGRWVTTDLEETDGTLTFYSREGERVRQVTSAELAPPGQYHPPRSLLGWGRSDKDGAAWIVNVGSEQGYATVRVGPEGPARVLAGIERWELCHPRALGPRGWYITMWVPDDAGQALLTRESAGHGPNVGFPTYSIGEAASFSLEGDPETRPPGKGRVTLPDGNRVFGFWPGGQDLFIGTEAEDETTRRRLATVPDGTPILDKTWFFDRQWNLQGWTRARRLADAADGRSLLLRAVDDSRVVTLGPDRRVGEVRRFAWPGGKTAEAVKLFDDLRLGLFVRRGKLVLAGW